MTKASTTHSHQHDCPDYKAAAADRAQNEVQRRDRQERLQVSARAEWLGMPDAGTAPAEQRQPKPAAAGKR
jgi:hypothetical protein